MDPYLVLGVARDATPADIRRAYMAQAKRLHPDAGGTTAEFAAIQSAYEILRNPATRQEYDETGRVNGAEDADAAALAILSQVFQSILAGDAEPTGDIVQSVVRHITLEIEKPRGQLDSLERAKARAEKMLAKAVGASPEAEKRARVPNMLRWHIRNIDEVLLQTRKQISHLERARELVREWDIYLDDPRMNDMSWYFNQQNNSSTF